MVHRLADHLDLARAAIGSGRAPISADEVRFAQSRRAMGASWDAIGRMLGGRCGEDVRRACEPTGTP